MSTTSITTGHFVIGPKIGCAPMTRKAIGPYPWFISRSDCESRRIVARRAAHLSTRATQRGRNRLGCNRRGWRPSEKGTRPRFIPHATTPSRHFAERQRDDANRRRVVFGVITVRSTAFGIGCVLRQLPAGRTDSVSKMTQSRSTLFKSIQCVRRAPGAPVVAWSASYTWRC